MTMQHLIFSAKKALQQRELLPFAVYSSRYEQHLLNVPMIKPLLVCVFDGCKQLGQEREVNCPAGQFVFLSNSPKVEMRNIPSHSQYFALLIEFEFSDFSCLGQSPALQPQANISAVQGDIDPVLQQTLQQFIEWSTFAPQALWPTRRQEILQLLYHQGYHQITAFMASSSLSHKLHALFSAEPTADRQADQLCEQLAMSESTLRRKLRAEGTSLQEIKDRVRLGLGLHLVQTTLQPIGLIAEQCGYQSQSRFTDKFKQLFGTTPTELRKTRLPETGE